MKTIKLVMTITVMLLGLSIHANAQTNAKVPEYLLGKFTDDYGIRYTVTDSVFTQHPATRYKIISWNLKEQYIIARNDQSNRTEPELYTRIDFMNFENMAPYLWGFCLSAYKSNSAADAEGVKIADRQNPKKGCNGFPFSRMKRITE